MRIGFVMTNFNGSRYTVKAVESIFGSDAAGRCVVIVVDNQSHPDDVAVLESLEETGADVHVIKNPQNVGYFRGLNIGLRYLEQHVPALDAVVVGNNDLVFPGDFLESLERKKDVLKVYPVISPDVVTPDGVHQNPLLAEPVGRIGEIVWDVYYSSYLSAALVRKALSVVRGFRARKNVETRPLATTVHQGHGSCYILTPVFFENFDGLWAPSFLMGEEFFLSKQIESRGFRVYYEPEIAVQHCDNATVSSLPSRKKWKILKDSHAIYRKFVNPYRANMNTGYSYEDYLRDHADRVNR